MTLTTDGFDHQPRTRLVFGVNTVDRVGELARHLVSSPPEETGSTVNQCLIVTDNGIAKAGHVARVQQHLEAAGFAVTLYTDVKENPTAADVAHCAEVAGQCGPDLIVGVGGGSSMDTAKGCNFIHTNGGRMQDYWGYDKATRPMLPLIAIPTTAGTGSECQSFALIADEKSHQKMACGDPKAAACIAILDPTLTVTQPRLVTADTGIDAITHAVETAVTNKRNPLSLLYAREAFKLTSRSLPRVLDAPDDLDARGNMLLGAAYGGIAIENSMLGGAHSAANPLTAHYNVIHGQAVGLMLPHVVRFNSKNEGALANYHALAQAAGLVNGDSSLLKSVDTLVDHLYELLDTANIPIRADKVGLTGDMIPTLAIEAAGQWTAQFNPRPIEASDFERLYEAAMDGRA